VPPVAEVNLVSTGLFATGFSPPETGPFLLTDHYLVNFAERRKVPCDSL